MILLDDKEQEVSCIDGACICCSGKCSNNESPAEAIELSEIIHRNQQNVLLLDDLIEAAPLLLNISGSPDEVGEVMVDENPSIL